MSVNHCFFMYLVSAPTDVSSSIFMSDTTWLKCVLHDMSTRAQLSKCMSHVYHSHQACIINSRMNSCKPAQAFPCANACTLRIEQVQTTLRMAVGNNQPTGQTTYCKQLSSNQGACFKCVPKRKEFVNPHAVTQYQFFSRQSHT